MALARRGEKSEPLWEGNRRWGVPQGGAEGGRLVGVLVQAARPRGALYTVQGLAGGTVTPREALHPGEEEAGGGVGGVGEDGGYAVGAHLDATP